MAYVRPGFIMVRNEAFLEDISSSFRLDMDRENELVFRDHLDYLKMLRAFSLGSASILEMIRQVDANWRREEHNRLVIQVPARDSWDRLPLPLVSALGRTLSKSGIKRALTNTAPSHFNSTTILGHHRVFDDHFMSPLWKSLNQHPTWGTRGITQQDLDSQQYILSRLGGHIEKICLVRYSKAWPSFIPVILYQQKLRKLQLIGPTKCTISMYALDAIKDATRWWSFRELHLSQLHRWEFGHAKDLQKFVAYVSPHLRSLTLDGTYPMSRDIPMPIMTKLRSLNVSLKTTYCYNRFFNLSKLYETIKRYPKNLETFGLSFVFDPLMEDPNMDRLYTELFPLLGKMSNLRKLKLSITIGYQYQFLFHNAKVAFANNWKAAAQKELNEEPDPSEDGQLLLPKPRLTKLEVLRLEVHSNASEHQKFLPFSCTTYKFWLEIFQVNVPNVRKLIFVMPINLVFSALLLEASPRNCTWKYLETLVVIFTKNTSLIKPPLPEVLFGRFWFASKIFSETITSLSLVDLPILNAGILANIVEFFPMLAEFNISSKDGQFYRQMVDFDHHMAATVEKLKCLRILRFNDTYVKMCFKTITTMCNRAMEVNVDVTQKKMLLYVPLNPLILRKKEITELMIKANQVIAIY